MSIVPVHVEAAASRRARVGLRWLVPWLTVLGSLGLWELLSRVGVLPSQEFPAVSLIARKLGSELGTSDFWAGLLDTIEGWGLGFLLAVGAGLPLGILVGSSRPIYRSIRLVVDFLRPIPPVTILPLAVLLVGTGTQMKVYLVAFSAFFPILFQTLYGVQDVDPVARDTVRSYGLSRFAEFWRVVIPSAAPYIVTGVQLAATIALVVDIATELIVGSQGLGYQINQVFNANDVPTMWALIFVVGLLGLGISIAFRTLERRLLRWHTSQRQGMTQ